MDSSVDTNTNSLLNSLEPWSDTATDITFPSLLDIHTYELTDNTTTTHSIDTSHHLNIIPSTNIQLESNNSSPASHIEKPCLQNILKNSIRGRRVLNHYEKFQCLNPDLQKDLTHVIIDSFEIQDVWLNTKELEYYANQIHLLFPTERSVCNFFYLTSLWKSRNWICGNIVGLLIDWNGSSPYYIVICKGGFHLDLLTFLFLWKCWDFHFSLLLRIMNEGEIKVLVAGIHNWIPCPGISFINSGTSFQTPLFMKWFLYNWDDWLQNKYLVTPSSINKYTKPKDFE